MRNIIKYLKSTGKVKEFYKYCKRDPEYNKLTLHLDMYVRWNSAFRMISNAIILKRYLNIFLQSLIPIKREETTYYDKIVLERLSDEDWEELDKVHSFLVNFDLFTKFFEGDKYPTLG